MPKKSSEIKHKKSCKSIYSGVYQILSTKCGVQCVSEEYIMREIESHTLIIEQAKEVKCSNEQ